MQVLIQLLEVLKWRVGMTISVSRANQTKYPEIKFFSQFGQGPLASLKVGFALVLYKFQPLVWMKISDLS